MKEHIDFSDFAGRLVSAGNSAKVGKLNGQRFYALRYAKGEELAMPFARKKFSVLINAAGKVSENEVREIGLKLLRHGMVCAICIGDEAEKISEIIDEEIDDGGFVFDGNTPYTQVGSGSLGEELELFVLPTGLTEVGLILTLGDDHLGPQAALNDLFILEDFDEALDDEAEDEGLDTIAVFSVNFDELDELSPEFAFADRRRMSLVSA
ncbi:hypothetical protein AGMMS49959_17430 [Planctomycetales bacterium]|nr:hypothetical protein AGMMS49959_17430 [Planctomycetales bacterium]